MKKNSLVAVALLALVASASAQTYVNGPFVTHPGAYLTCGAPAPGNGSSLENVAPLLMGTFGYTASIAAGFRVADDFTVPSGQSWSINSFKVYGYQTGSTTTSTFNDARYRLWCGQPGAGGTVINDFTAASQFVSTAFTNCFRATAATIGNCTTGNTRPIMEVVMNGNGLVLGPGTYWLEFALGGTSASGPFVPPISILGQGETGNAVQITVASGAVNVVTSGARPFATGLPFEVSYTSAPGPAAQWETNDAAAGLTFNGVNANANCAAAIATVCVGAPLNATFSGTAGTFGWDLAIGTLPAVSLSGGGVATTGFQTVNINLADPTLVFLNGLTFAVPHPIPFGAAAPATLSFPMPALPTLTAQSILIDPGHPDGFSLTQAAQANSTTGPGLTFPIAGPATDDSAIAIPVGQIAPSCANFGIPFFGTVQDVMVVHSNGYVQFDPIIALDTTPTAQEAIYRRIVGLWHNLNPAAVGSGNITVTSAGSVVSVNYNGVFRFGSTVATNASTYSINFDVLSGVISITGLNGVTAGTIAAWLGISAGAGGIPGASTTFSAPNSYPIAAGGMLYQQQAAITVPVITSITFTPNGSGGYTATTL